MLLKTFQNHFVFLNFWKKIYFGQNFANKNLEKKAYRTSVLIIGMYISGTWGYHHRTSCDSSHNVILRFYETIINLRYHPQVKKAIIHPQVKKAIIHKSKRRVSKGYWNDALTFCHPYKLFWQRRRVLEWNPKIFPSQ